MKDTPITRRTLIAGAAAAAGGALIANIGDADAQQKPAVAAPPPAAPSAPADPTKVPGGPTTAVGTRSPFVNPQRTPVGEITGTALSPLQDLTGTITPSDLHFVRIHAGVPTIDPAKHTLLIHGLVDRPMEFTVADLKRFPAVTRTYFIECSGNGRAAYRTPSRR
jgi:sulfane dehydrogenase subunit SoxC